MRHFIVSFILLALGLMWRAQAEIESIWSTDVAVPGEQVVLYLVLTPTPQEQGERARLYIPRVQGASVREGIPTAVESKGKDGKVVVLQIRPIYVTPDAAGDFQMGDVEILHQAGNREKVKIPPLHVHATTDIKWYNKPFSYGVLWHCDSGDAYTHQTIKAAFKLFLPKDTRYHTRWFVQYAPTFNAVGVDFGMFRPALDGVMASVQNTYINEPSAFAKGQEWRTIDYTGTFTPTDSGNLNVTGKVSLMRVQGYNMTEQTEAVLPTLTISALPLPKSAPADFANMVGGYSISTKTTAESLAMNEAVEVEITIHGTDGLAQVKCPVPESMDSWKLNSATRKELTDINGNITGIVYTQIMRPTTETDGIPAFSLGYFDPKKQEYRTASSKPIPLPWRKTDEAGLGLQTAHSAEPPPAGIVPVAEMTDIYSTYMPESGVGVHVMPRWVCYLLYLPAAGILLTLLGMAVHRRVQAGAASRAQERELSALNRKEDAISFLKGIGAFIESRIPASSITPELQSILDKRDSVAFRPDAKTETIGTAERNAMLKQVRTVLSKLGQLVILPVLGLLLFAGSAMAEESASDPARKDYEANQFSACLEKLQGEIDKAETPAAELWYNAGNCHYRLNHPGQAALYYARALQEKPWLREAAANLAFIQRKQGAVLPIRSTTDSVFTFLSAGQLRLATIASTALLALCIALQIARRKHPKPWLHVTTAITLLLSLLCGINQIYYSTREVTDISALPPADLAYVVTTTDARTAADAAATSVLQLPAATPVHLLARRGSWSYVETFTGIRGWVKSDTVESLLPGSTPSIPVYVRFE